MAKELKEMWMNIDTREEWIDEVMGYENIEEYGEEMVWPNGYKRINTGEKIKLVYNNCEVIGQVIFSALMHDGKQHFKFKYIEIIRGDF